MNTLIEYEYRDAEGYSVFDIVIVKGSCLQEDKIKDCYLDGEFFIPSQVGLPDLQEGWNSSRDHVNHKILRIEPTEAPATMDISSVRLVWDFKRAKGKWDITAAMKRHGAI